MSTAYTGESLANAADAAALNEWHRIITQRDWQKLPDLLADDVAYHNPAQLEPYRGKEALVGILQLVFSIFEDFQYHRRFHGTDGHVLEFSARVGDSPIFGIDSVRFNDEGIWSIWLLCFGQQTLLRSWDRRLPAGSLQQKLASKLRSILISM